MRRWFWLAPFALLALVFFRPVPARANLQICNKTDYKVSVAVATLSGDCYIDYCTERIQGWWNIDAGDCKTPIGGDLDTSGDTDYYFYAESSNSTWTGSLPLCIDPNYEFDYNQREDDACTSNTKKNFQRIKTENYRNYTLSLTPS